MPRDTNGNTQPLPGTIVSTGDTILPSQHNPAMVDLYAMMTQSLSRDGQGGMRAPLNMSGFTVTNSAPGTLPGDLATVGQGMPIGSVVDFAGTTAPDGWLLCFGQARSRTTDASLFSVIGTTYGAGDGSTTFNIPDCRGRVTAGKDDMGGPSAARLTASSMSPNAVTLGASGGAQTHFLTSSEMPAHSHSGGTNTGGSHSHTVPILANLAGAGVGTGAMSSFGSTPTSTDGAHSHSFTTNSSGGGGAHNNVQPTIIMNKIIKVSY